MLSQQWYCHRSSTKVHSQINICWHVCRMQIASTGIGDDLIFDVSQYGRDNSVSLCQGRYSLCPSVNRPALFTCCFISKSHRRRPACLSVPLRKFLSFLKHLFFTKTQGIAKITIKIALLLPARKIISSIKSTIFIIQESLISLPSCFQEQTKHNLEHESHG